jgi:glutamine amidotransferase
MNALEQLDFKKALLRHVVENGKPVLGICLGMQLLFQQSEESPGIMGLGVVPGTVRMLPRSGEYKVPRIGWRQAAFSPVF